MPRGAETDPAMAPLARRSSGSRISTTSTSPPAISLATCSAVRFSIEALASATSCAAVFAISRLSCFWLDDAANPREKDHPTGGRERASGNCPEFHLEHPGFLKRSGLTLAYAARAQLRNGFGRALDLIRLCAWRRLQDELAEAD